MKLACRNYYISEFTATSTYPIAYYTHIPRGNGGGGGGGGGGEDEGDKEMEGVEEVEDMEVDLNSVIICNN